MPTQRWLPYATVLALWAGGFASLCAETTSSTVSGTKKSSNSSGKKTDSPSRQSTSKDSERTRKAGDSSDSSAASSSTPNPSAKTNEGSSTQKKSASEATPAPAPQTGETAAPVVKERAPNATISTSDLADFAAQPPAVQRLITNALELTKLNLTYTYGSADPARGGMDCSGTMYYTLRAEGLRDVPRDSPGQYVWVRKAGGFQAVVSTSTETFELDALRPGDLLFWSGTYAVVREIPITHVMLYLGREKKTGQRVMFGASDGRSYRGVQRWGVSVFDFKMPKADPSRGTTPDFIGYGPIPGLSTSTPVASLETPKPPPEPIAAAQEDSSPKPVAAAKSETSAVAKKKSNSTGKSSASKSGSSRKKSSSR